MRTAPQAKSETIVTLVQRYFHEYALDVFHGQICTKDILCYVRHHLHAELGARMTKIYVAEVFKAISTYGPVGEGDTHWLALYGSELVPYLAPTTPTVRCGTQETRELIA